MRSLVVGAAKSGVAAANFLAGRGEEVILADSKAAPRLPYELDSGVEKAFGRDDLALLDRVDEIVISPGVPLGVPLLREASLRMIPIVGEIELAYRHLNGTVIAVTGSNGKSTTTSLIGEILRVAGREPIVAGNIGEPLIASLDFERPRTYVLELSSFQLEAVDKFHADIALLLNITPDHMDRYPTFDAYAAAKHRIFRHQTASDHAIVNTNLSIATAAQVLRFSSTEHADAYLDGDDLVLHDRRIPRASLKLQGTPNVENALAAWLAARVAGVDEVDTQIAFGTFAGLPHRMVLVRERDGVKWINDSKGTNVDATIAALQSFPSSSVWLILGGYDKHGEFERMRDLVRDKTKGILTIGKAADVIKEKLDGAAPITPLGDMEHAVKWASENAKSGDLVLLSPACASFDQYRNFEHRGEHFEELVHALPGNPATQQPKP
ncbi:MAG TPA: UDP-N-acetylmuramoyl-L-alanine--D-glutamate ligase [Thermoanaerobaculia bacterium]